MERAQLKAMAKEQIKGNIGILFVCSLIIGLIGGVLTMIPVAGSIAYLVVAPVLGVALCAIYLNLTQGQKPVVGDLFTKFDQLVPALVSTLLVALFTFLWSLLLIIPGIVKSLSYSMSSYILADNPGITGKEALERSKAMMEGHKMELFVLQLSFIGWHLLGAITMGIAYIWILPYMSATVANFYNSIKGSVDAVPVESIPETTI